MPPGPLWGNLILKLYYLFRTFLLFGFCSSLILQRTIHTTVENGVHKLYAEELIVKIK